MHQPEKSHEHRSPCAGERAHTPACEQANQRIDDHAAQRIAPFSAERGQQADEYAKSELKRQARREHGAQDAKQDEKQLCPRVQTQRLHWVIPAFSNCLFSILQPTNALNAAARTVPASITIRIHALPAERMASM